MLTLKEAKEIAGTLGNPRKMPGYSYGLPAARAAWVPAECERLGLPVPPVMGCAVGGRMSAIVGTTCYQCYADGRGQYGAPSVRHGQTLRLVGCYNPRWTEAMIRLIGHYCGGDDAYFRWHDSGDLLGYWHLEAIATIAAALPDVRFWLPTREAMLVVRFIREHGHFPSNLCIRVSSTKVDAGPPVGLPKAYVTTSTVHDTAAPIGKLCDAAHRGGQCGPCRACWNRKVSNVSYHVH